MKARTRPLRSFSLVAAPTFAGLAYGQQPPDTVSSDANNNTAMGTLALLNLSDVAGCTPACNRGNTAAVASSLLSNTIGSQNTAIGAFARAGLGAASRVACRCRRCGD